MSSLFISAIVLAAGESRRMGSQNKLLLPFENKPLITHVVDTILQAEVDEVIVVVGHEAVRIRHALEGYGITCAHNPDYPAGMTTSIRVGVEVASADASGFMICLSDLPLITSAELNHLIAAFREANEQNDCHIIRPIYKDTPGNPVLFPASYRTDIIANQEMTGCKNLIRQNQNLVLDLEMPTDHVLRDIDTPDTYLSLLPRTNG